ncbi:cupin domain-containing protein [uncultured Limimaricola sp.]|uniref:cupin domain-containing protein n=1 Tax=uncultured Limimaricola sp. TaxID=2211667 RepID=UPI0030FB24CB
MSGSIEHASLTVDLLAERSPQTMEATIGLAGYSLRFRVVEIGAGSQITKHDYVDRLGIVTVIDGSRVGDQPSGERGLDAASLDPLPETKDTVRGVYNRTAAPATALVCDIAKVE